jgi:DNA-directed RNA polymerase specialized sigma24 family protein
LQTSPTRAYDENSLDYFETEVLPLTDLVYRFGHALCGSSNDARMLLQRTFGTATKEFPNFMRIRDFNMKAYLIAECWRLYSTGNKSTYQQPADRVGQLIGKFPLESRVTLFAIDVAGLTPVDAAKAFGTSERDIRLKLAAARRALIAVEV